MSKKYELMMIFSPELSEKEVLTEIEKVKKSAESHEGKILSEDFWGKRRLAYIIKKHDSGYYFVMEISLDPSKVSEFEKEIILRKSIIRYIVICEPKNYEQKKKIRAKIDANNTKKQPLKNDKNPEGSADVNKEMLDEKLEKILGNDLNI